MKRPAGLLIAGALLAGIINSPQVLAQTSPVQQPYVWRNVNIGGGGGFITGIIFHPKQPGLAYVRTDIGGVYRFDVKTHRWIPLTDWVGSGDGNLRGAESLAIDPTNPKRVYVAAGTYSQAGQKTAILRSNDQGRTWRQTAMPGVEMGGNEDGRNIGERLAVDPSSPNIIYFGSRHNGLFRSTDYGATFKHVDGFPSVPDDPAPPPGEWRPKKHAGIGLIVFPPSSSKNQPSQIIYAGVDAPEMPGLYRSTDAGVTWKPVPGQPPAGMMPQHAAFASDGMLYICYSNALGPNGISNGAVYKFDPRSGIWSDISPVKITSAHPGGYSGLAIDPAHPKTIAVSTLDYWNPGDDVFYSTDGGAHWSASRAKATMDSTGAPWLTWGKDEPTFGWWTSALAMDPFHPTHILYGTGATIWGTDNIAPALAGQSTHWHMAANGIEETAALALISPPAGPPLVTGLGDIGGFTHEDLAVSPPNGMPTPLLTTTNSLDFAELAPATMVRAGTPGGGSHAHGEISADSGATWTAFATEPDGTRSGGSIVLTADGKAILWAPGGAAPSYSRDAGQSWIACGGLSGDGSSHFAFTADRADPTRVYALNTDTDTSFVSADGGATFTPTYAHLPQDTVTLKAVPGHTGDLWAACGGSGLWHSTDGGMTYKQISSLSVAEGIGFGKAAPERDYPAIYLVGTPESRLHGVYRSDDAGKTWVRINDDQHQYGWIGEPITGDPRVYGRVYLGTNGRGVLMGDPVGSAASSKE